MQKQRPVFGVEEFSEEFLNDLRFLVSEERYCDNAATIALRYATERGFSKDDVLEAIRELSLNPGQFKQVAGITLFYAQQLLLGRLETPERELLEERLNRLGFTPQEEANFYAFLQKLESGSSKARFEAARIHYLSTGCPRLKAAAAVCDLRGIYELGDERQSTSSDATPMKLLALDPVILLELRSELNKVSENHVFQLSGRQLDQLIGILKRVEDQCHDLLLRARQGPLGELIIEEEER